jgi:hypothetical protein
LQKITIDNQPLIKTLDFFIKKNSKTGRNNKVTNSVLSATFQTEVVTNQQFNQPTIFLRKGAYEQSL